MVVSGESSTAVKDGSPSIPVAVDEVKDNAVLYERELVALV